jgi:Flp pilus assembly protein TadB
MGRRATRSSDDERSPRLRAVPRHEPEPTSTVEEVVTAAPQSGAGRSPTRRARLTFVVLAAALALAGVALLGPVPAAGLVCLVAAAVVGALAALTPSREVEPERTTEPPER